MKKYKTVSNMKLMFIFALW